MLSDTKAIFLDNCDIKDDITNAMKNVCMHYGHTYVGLKEIAKMNGHPTTLGMAQICEQILTNID